MQENIITHKGRRTLVLGSGASVLLTALEKTQMVTGAVDRSIKETCTIYPSRLTSADVAELIRSIIDKGADLTLKVDGNETDNKLLDSVLSVARTNGTVIEIDGVEASSEALGLEDIQEMTVIAHLTDTITLRKVPAGEDVEYIVFIPTEDAINESLVAYAQALETIKDKSHLVVLPSVKEVSEVTKALMELVIQNDGFITDDPETFKVIDQETDVSSESFKDVIKKVIDFFKPLPADHIKKVSKKVKRNMYWSADIEKQNMLITQLLDDYLDNPNWMGKQGYKSGKISSTDFAYITSTGTVKVSELASDISASAKSLNSLLKDFEKEAHVYLRELNKKIPYVDMAVGAGTYLPKDSVAFSVIVNTALNTLRSITKPLQVMNFKNYPITGYTTSRELTRPPQPLYMKVSVDSLNEKTFPLAVNALRALVKEELHYVDYGAYVVRSLSPAVINHLRGTAAGEELLEYCSESGFYNHSGWLLIPTPYAFRYRIAMGLITLMLSSLVIKDPRR